MNSDDKAWFAFNQDFRDNLVPKLLSSSIYLGIGSSEWDVKFAAELGAAIIMDKPILLVVPKGRTISEHFRRVADIVVDDWDIDDTNAQTRMIDAMQQLLPTDNTHD